jgi:hypothetical protein
MKFSVTPTFPSMAQMSWPDADKPDVFRRYDIECRFKAGSNDPEAKAEMERKQLENGTYAFLNEVLVSVQLPATIEPVDDNDAPMDPLEWVKTNPLAGGAAIVAYWNVINRDLEAKNSKRLRGR